MENTDQGNETNTLDEDLDSDLGTDLSNLSEEEAKLLEDEWNTDDEVDGIENGSEFSSDDSSDDCEKCPICLLAFKGQDLGNPETCEHHFCLKCIHEWSKKVATCPIDRKSFSSILVRNIPIGKVLGIQDVELQEKDETEYTGEPTFCEICGRSDREESLLLCDGCDLGFHLECLEPPLEYVPIEDWFCTRCQPPSAANGEEHAASSSRNMTTTRVPRTGQSRRILETIRRTARSNATSANNSTASNGRRKVKRSKGRSKRKGNRRKKSNCTAPKRGRKKSKRRVVLQRKLTSSRARLAHSLGIRPPKKGQVYVGVPYCTRAPSGNRVSEVSSSSLSNQRFQAGIAPLRLFGTSNDISDSLDALSDNEGSVGILRPPSYARHVMIPSKRGITIHQEHISSSPDVLGPILNSQYILHKDKNIKIQRDGTLVPSIQLNIPSKSDSNKSLDNDNSSGYDSSISISSPVKQSSKGEKELSNSIRRAPASPGSTHNISISYNRQSNSDINQNTASASGWNNSDITANENISYGHGCIAGSSNQPDTAVGNRSYESFLATSASLPCTSRKKSTDSSKKDDSNKSNVKDDEEEFDIYSDIEEDPEAMDPQVHNANRPESLLNPAIDPERTKDHDSDSDMVIDEEEAAAKRISSDKESQQSRDSPTRAVSKNNPESSSNTNSSYPIAQADPISILSIPLPADSPPLTSQSKIVAECSPSKYKTKEEYDPSQPLTSSDEDEDFSETDKLPSASTRSKKIISLPKNHKERSSRNVREPLTQSTPDVDKIDLSSIPMPNEEYKRPTIQFSIPTRHRLVPISSLIKRQKGILRKDSKVSNAFSFHSEVSKAFRPDGKEEEKSDREDIEEPNDGLDPRSSLVAEIFGSDDEENGNHIDREDTSEADIDKKEAFKRCPVAVQDSNVFEESSRWKKIEDDQKLLEKSEPSITHSSPNYSDSNVKHSRSLECSEPSSQDDATCASDHLSDLMHPGDSETHSNGTDKPPSAITACEKEGVAEDDDPVIFISSVIRNNKFKGPNVLESITDSESDPDITFLQTIDRSDKARTKHRDSSREKTSESLKRKNSSSSLSFFEEGEIYDTLDKKRKRPKKKKSKKRRRSKESHSRSPSYNEFEDKAISNPTFDSSSDENKKMIAWRKPSKFKDRNYRDGKPKAEEQYFKEKENITEKFSDRNSYSKESVRRKSKDKKDGKSRRCRSASRSSWSHPRSPLVEKSRSRTPYRRKRNNRSRSRSRNLTPRSQTRSPSVRRSKKPVRRSPSFKETNRGRSRSTEKSKGSKSSKRISRKQTRSPSIGKARKDKKRHRSGSSRSSKAESFKKSKKRRKDKLEEKAKKKKEKIKEKEKEKAPLEQKELESRERDKKRKRKRKEKSVSPVKAIVAEGDSIVVSLNFNKGKESLAINEAHKEISSNLSKPEPVQPRKRSKSREALDASTGKDSNRNKQLKKTVLIDLETSPVQEQSIGCSPTTILIDSEEEDGDGSKRRKKEENTHNDRDKETVVTSSSPKMLGDENLGFHLKGQGVPADSTQAQINHGDDHEIISKKREGSFNSTHSLPYSPNPLSPPSPSSDKNDTLVTSTRDSTDAPAPDDSRSPDRLDSKSDNTSPPSPVSLTPPRPPGGATEMCKTLSPSAAASSNSSKLPSFGSSIPSGPPLGKPPIGNIPGLFGTTSNANFPQPIVIPAPPAAPVRFPQAVTPSLLNPNVLASVATVANALYAPFARQQQGLLGRSSLLMNNSSNIQHKTLVNISSNAPKHQGVKTTSGGEGDSPFSPNSSDGDDLFEPPKDKNNDPDANRDKQSKVVHNSSTNGNVGPAINKNNNPRNKNLFDSLFGASEKVVSKADRTKIKASSAHHNKRKGTRKENMTKLTEGELRLTEDVPTSAVELRVKEKFLKKLNRQERVVEEVKLCLKPHYNKKHISKDEYKEILRRAVPKICHNKSGEINPFKIKELVEAYVKKFRHQRGRQK